MYVFFFKQKTAYEIYQCDWSSDVCSSDLFPNNMKQKGHLIPKESRLITKKAKVKKLILTHLYPTSSGEVRLNQTKKIFKNTVLSKDLMKVEI